MSWIVLVALVLVVATPASAKKKKAKEIPSAEELFNPMLGVDYSHWLVGPIVLIASEQERRVYLSLTTDAEAEAFVAAFWAKRNEDTPVFQDTPQEIFAARVEEADKRFTEAVYPGSRTARGLRFVLYGEPESITFEKPEEVGDPTPELWTYAKDAEVGLDGTKPERHYRFMKDGEFTVLYDDQLRRKIRRRTLRPSLPPR